MLSRWYSIKFSFQTCLMYIKSGWQAWYFFNSHIHSHPSQYGSQVSFMWGVGPWVVSSSSYSPSSLPALESTSNGSVGFLMYQSVSALFQSAVTITSRSFGVDGIQPSMEVSGEVCPSSSSINSSSVQVYSRTCHKSVQTSYSSGIMLD